MPDIVWYYGLIVIGAVAIGYTAYRKGGAADILAYFLFTTALTWFGEAFVLFVFNAYSYKPGVNSDPFLENILGHMIANSGLWAAAAVWVMRFQPSLLRMALISIGFMLVEALFLRVGVYVHHWWQTYMTGIIAFVFLIAMKRWYMVLQETGSRFPRVAVFWTIAWVILQTPTSVLLLFDKQFFRVNWVDNLYRDSTLFSGFLYDVAMAFVVLFFMYVPKKRYWRAAPLPILVAADAWLWKGGILVFYDDWRFIYLIGIRAVSLVVIYLLERYTLNGVRVGGSATRSR